MDLGDEENQALSLHQLSMLDRLTEDYFSALARSQEAEALNRRLGREDGVSSNLHEQGLIYNRLANAATDNAEVAAYRQQAFESFSEGYTIAQRIDDKASASVSLMALGKFFLNADQMRESIAAFTEALEIVTQLGMPTENEYCSGVSRAVHERQGQYAAALEKFKQALALLRKHGSPRQIAIEEATLLECERRWAARDGRRWWPQGLPRVTGAAP